VVARDRAADQLITQSTRSGHASTLDGARLLWPVVDQHPAPARYGDGLAVLVVGTADAPFPARPPRVDAAALVVLVDSGAPHVPGCPAVVRIGEDVGRGAAVNRAVAGLPPAIGLVAVAPAGLDWPDGTLDALCAAAGRHPRAGILAPRVLDAPTAHPLPRPARAVLRRTWPPAREPAGEGPVGWSSAPALLLRRVALDSVGGFDPRYAGRFDDLDLADRLGNAGWLTVHVPSATITYHPTARPDPVAARRYLADRAPRPVHRLLRPPVRS
jgi:N-acetylglucosaminyl-diphospho-decaprenol L-rhamnosyltransferase